MLSVRVLMRELLLKYRFDILKLQYVVLRSYMLAAWFLCAYLGPFWLFNVIVYGSKKVGELTLHWIKCPWINLRSNHTLLIMFLFFFAGCHLDRAYNLMIAFSYGPDEQVSFLALFYVSLKANCIICSYYLSTMNPWILMQIVICIW